MWPTWLQAKKDPTLRTLEARLRNARYLGELVKFRVAPFGSIFVMLKVSFVLLPQQVCLQPVTCHVIFAFRRPTTFCRAYIARCCLYAWQQQLAASKQLFAAAVPA